MYKIDKTTWEVMRSTKNKVLTEDFSRVLEHEDHGSKDLFDEPEQLEQPEQIEQPEQVEQLEQLEQAELVEQLEQIVQPEQLEQNEPVNKDPEPEITIEEELKTENKDHEIFENLKRDFEIEKSKFRKQAKESAIKIEKTAYEKGYSECAEKIKQTMNAKLDALVIKQNESIENLEKDTIAYKEKLNSEILENTLGLSLEIAGKIVNSELKKHDDIFVKIVKDAILHMDSDEEISVKVSYHDYQKYFLSEVEAIRKEMGIKSLNIAASSKIEDGGCIVETDKSFIDAGINTQLKVIADAITEETKKNE